MPDDMQSDQWHHFYFAALAGVIAQQGVPTSTVIADVLKRCAAFADDAVAELERGKAEPEYQMFFVGGNRP